MPYSAGAFFLFGLCSVPAGRLGDLWGRRRMMLVFFFGMGVGALLAACTSSPWQLAVALSLIGLFASIYHPVGIPMLVQGVNNPGAVIGFNGLVGNLGIAAAALVTGLLVQWFGWRSAFAVPGLAAVGCGIAFARYTPGETEPPAARKQRADVSLSPAAMVRVLTIMTVASATASLLFNFTTNGNGRLLAERFQGIVDNPAWLGALLAVVYTIGSLAQVVVGRLIDRMALKPLYLSVVLAQVPLAALAATARGWWLFVLLLGLMVFIFGATPFTDAMVVRYVDDRMRSRVAGMRIGISFTISSIAVWALGPIVKSSGFDVLLFAMASIALVTVTAIALLPADAALARRAPAMVRAAMPRRAE
jgi:MFS family permease